MREEPQSNLRERLTGLRGGLTPKGRALADFVLENPRQAVFLRTRALAEACGVSEATVIRFVGRLGYGGYPEFIQALRDMVDTELTLMDRAELTSHGGPEAERLGRAVLDEITNLRRLYESLDMETVQAMVSRILDAGEVYVVGSRLSYTFAYYLGWSLTKVRPGVRTLQGSDSTTIDILGALAAPALVILITIARYPNELIKLAKAVRRAGHDLIVITDGPLCPALPFAHLSFVAPVQHFPVIGSPSTIHCFVNCLTQEMIARGGAVVRRHQEQLEQVFRENDLLFNLEK